VGALARPISAGFGELRVTLVTTDRKGKTLRSLIAALFASRYPDNVFALNKKSEKDLHDAYGVNLANARARGIMSEFKKLGVRPRTLRGIRNCQEVRLAIYFM
jgi:hypothetical protein